MMNDVAGSQRVTVSYYKKRAIVNFFFNNGSLIKKNTIFASLFKNRY